jgi:cysteine desulfurase/selenocysteine lyase
MFFRKKELVTKNKKDNDFPVLDKLIKGRPVIYFDNACVTLRPRSVNEAVGNYYDSLSSCARRSPHYLGQRTSELVDKSRESLARYINAEKASEVIFTKNTTEAINTIARGLKFNSSDAIVTSNMEHNSNILPWMRLSETVGLEHILWDIEPDGSFDLNKLFETLKSGRVKLLSLFMRSHVLGIRLPVEEIIEVAHKNNVLVLLDCAQSFPHELIDVKSLGADFLAFSMHKAFGPSAVGLLYINEKHFNRISPSILGGETVENVKRGFYQQSSPPHCFEAGLQNYSGIIGTKAAIEYIESLTMNDIIQRELKLGEYLFESIKSVAGVKLLGDLSSNTILTFSADNIKADELSLLLNNTANIMTRSGVHCSHLWFNDYSLAPQVRVSLAFYNSIEEIDTFIATLKDLLKFHSRN